MRALGTEEALGVDWDRRAGKIRVVVCSDGVFSQASVALFLFLFDFVLSFLFLFSVSSVGASAPPGPTPLEAEEEGPPREGVDGKEKAPR